MDQPSFLLPEHVELLQKYGVSNLPTDVVLTPQGQVVNIALGKTDATRYIARLNQLAASVRQPNAGVPVSLPAEVPGRNINPPTINPPLAAMPTTPALPSPAAPQPVVPAPAYGQSLGLNGPANGPNAPANSLPPQAVPPAMPPVMPPAVGQPSNAPPNYAAPLPSLNPPLALDGYSPVSLVEKHQWILGDKRFGAYHQGRTYLFTGPEEQSRFLAHYDLYAPVASGLDVVLAADEHKSVPGMRAHGVFFADRVFLFANEDTLQKFNLNRYYYAGLAMGTSRQAASPGPQPR